MQHCLQPLYWVFEHYCHCVSMWLGIFNSQVATNFINVAGRKRKFIVIGSNMAIADYVNSIKMRVKQWNVTESAGAVFETMLFCF